LELWDNNHNKQIGFSSSFKLKLAYYLIGFELLSGNGIANI